MARMIVGSIASKRSISTLSHLCERIKQTENEIVQMFQLSTPKDEMHNLPMRGKLPRKDPAVRTLDERFIRILKIFKWGPDAEKALEVLKLRVDHRLVREVLKIDVEVNVKIQFFKWAGKRRNFEHDSTTYMALIHCLDEAGITGEMWKTVQEIC
nr:pentatricopeptide repeat-containing protein At3g16010-like [Quercus suber]POE50991.1 pentatricopeptide repeat-containing protein [Quercus suber]